MGTLEAGNTSSANEIRNMAGRLLGEAKSMRLEVLHKGNREIVKSIANDMQTRLPGAFKLGKRMVSVRMKDPNYMITRVNARLALEDVVIRIAKQIQDTGKADDSWLGNLVTSAISNHQLFPEWYDDDMLAFAKILRDALSKELKTKSTEDVGLDEAGGGKKTFLVNVAKYFRGLGDQGRVIKDVKDEKEAIELAAKMMKVKPSKLVATQIEDVDGDKAKKTGIGEVREMAMRLLGASRPE